MNVNIESSMEAALDCAEQLSHSLNEPRWALDIRRAAAAAMRTLPMPQGREEEWHHTKPAIFFPQGRPLSLQLLEENLESTPLGQESTVLPVVKPLAQAIVENPDLEEHFFRAHSHQKEIFSAVNAAFGQGGAYVELPAGQKSNSLRLGHTPKLPDGVQGSLGHYLPHSLIIAQPQSQGVVAEVFTCPDGAALTSMPVIELYAAPGSHLEYVLVYDWGDAANCLTRIHARVASQASLNITLFCLGGQNVKVFLAGDVNAEGANLQINGLVFTDEERTCDVDTFVHHHFPGGTSNVLINCALTQASKTVFAGNILVEEQAQKSDAYQKNKNLLLSSAAKALSQPKLEIKADDVRCTHGASFTTFDDEQLFYLQSRGMDNSEARRLIITGFFQEIIEKIDHPELVGKLTTLMQERLQASLEKSGSDLA